MNKLQIGQKWKTRSKRNATIIAKNTWSPTHCWVVELENLPGIVDAVVYVNDQGRNSMDGEDCECDLQTLIFCPSWPAPDGKIQGVNVWVRVSAGGGGEWVIGSTPAAQRECELLFSNDKLLNSSNNPGYAKAFFFSTREDALAHLRQLEEKERPVVDLTTAKFGDRFERQDGKIETYACPQEGNPGWHVMQSGCAYTATGRWASPASPHYFDLVAPYTTPRTVEVWVEVFERPGCGTIAAAVYMSEAELQQGLQQSVDSNAKTIATFHKTIKDGEGLAEKT